MAYSLKMQEDWAHHLLKLPDLLFQHSRILLIADVSLGGILLLTLDVIQLQTYHKRPELYARRD